MDMKYFNYSHLPERLQAISRPARKSSKTTMATQCWAPWRWLHEPEVPQQRRAFRTWAQRAGRRQIENLPTG